ncbi:cytochrome-b5 reductase KNAG_0F02800 [Huiozyma naganishii CBS 8797]|uniref:NADH-cytochrome b5 reductase n=1 Tax=Huiozyma naganishii (strain ATCC MYA-139 / BCRC 22969 / CBS 8797 / KCTC 17520 / NBRC 10181 / NCYC 3082 / Yp74L-3) TaxID=1071383 RepID=J7S090_HUIN7|nr:hypothetical protein KNAG_0F02800 [Kazachstania naganishii CBS 8797]CCK70942.1 hypothetical protein KNAG_0F02800 [Kazachstania naganishii CBS 8797]
MLARFSRLSLSNHRILPYALGAGAVAATAFLYSYKFHTISNESQKVFTGDGSWIDLPISKIQQESHDTKRFFFKLPSEDAETGLTLASALYTKFVTEKGSNVVRPYTPVSDLGDKGGFELVVKHYPDGKMSNHLFSLKEKDTVSFKGPIKKWQWEPNSFDSILLLGAGTGITPLYQLAHHIVQNPKENTKVKLLYGNKTPEDILLKKELDQLQKDHPDKFEVVYFVDQNKKSTPFNGQVGFITKEYIEKNTVKPSEKTHVFLCGPPPFMNAYSGQKPKPVEQGELTGILKELGFTADQVFKF